jgi:hypothetical protein
MRFSAAHEEQINRKYYWREPLNTSVSDRARSAMEFFLHPFSALPEEVNMADRYLYNLLGQNENVILVARQHWLVLLAEIASELLLAMGISTFIAILTVTLLNPLILFGLFILIAPALSLTRDVLIWRNREYVITNRRVIQLSGVLNKSVSDSSLEKVNDVKLSQSFWGRMLDYGDIEILTASELGVNFMRRISQPIRYKTAMVDAKEQLERGGTPIPAEKKSGDLLSLLGQLDALRQKGILTEEEFQEKKKAILAKY